jgi:succinoglycan biosynthesis protein ExoA
MTEITPTQPKVSTAVPARQPESTSTKAPGLGHQLGIQRPLISVIVPCRNEAGHIERCVRSILDQDIPGGDLEIIVADGLSEDGTADTLRRLAREEPRVLVIENPGRIASTGLNAALATARGAVIVRVDGHAELAPDFLRQNLAVLREHPEAWSVGGPIIHVGRTAMGRAIARAMGHPLGVGNATHRFAHYEGYAEGTAFPAVRRWVFDRVGGFDETLVRNQDDEFNYRIHRAGGRVFITPRIKYRYFVRERLSQLFRQYFQYGFWRVPVIRKHRRPASLRQLVPSLFLAACVLLSVIGCWRRTAWLALILPLSYAGVQAVAGLARVSREGWAIALRLPAAIATMHVAYALGLITGVWATLFRRSAWTRRDVVSGLSR